MHDQNNAYRRGVILGLTLAEIMLLILFLLLLTFASVLSREKKQYEQKIQLLSKGNKNIEKVVTVLEESDPAITEELVEAFETLPAVTTLIKKENLKKSKSETTKQVVLRAMEKLTAEKAVESTSGESSIKDKLLKAVNDNEELKAQIANVQGQNKNILHQLNSQGKGADFPPCWADSKGRPEYIYNVYLSNDGITLVDNKIPHRQSEQAQLPISSVVYDEPISQGQFVNQTSDLKEWAVSHECHFYVRIYDETDGSKKALYKSLLRTVESSFYKVLM